MVFLLVLSARKEFIEVGRNGFIFMINQLHRFFFEKQAHGPSAGRARRVNRRLIKVNSYFVQGLAFKN